MWRSWQNRVPYDDTKYIESLKSDNNELYARVIAFHPHQLVHNYVISNVQTRSDVATTVPQMAGETKLAVGKFSPYRNRPFNQTR
jgi:hypothetical protein